MSSLNPAKVFLPKARNPFQQQFKRWLKQRIPPQQKITLSQRSIFIFPTKTGFTFIALLLMLLIAAINYENSLIFALTFWLGSIMFVTIFYTFRNLAGITVEHISHRDGYVGEDIEFHIKVSRPKASRREGIQLGWPNEPKQWAELYELEDTVLTLFAKATKRGWMNPDRLLIETYFPLGLLRAWTWIDLNAKALAYPVPIFQELPTSSIESDDEGHLTHNRGSDDFNDMRSYQPGDSPKHILWRSYAKQDELIVKEFAAQADSRLILDWHQVDGDVETRLSKLTGMAIIAFRNDKEFGLNLPNVNIAPNMGKAHFDQILKELALYGF